MGMLSSSAGFAMWISLPRAQLAPRVVHVGLPAQERADVLHLHAHLSHLATQLVIDQLVGGIGEKVARVLETSVTSVVVLNVDLKLRRI